MKSAGPYLDHLCVVDDDMEGEYAFFAYATERERVRIRREGQEAATPQPRPWTTDPILNEFRFCNVFREDDTVTRWFREHIRDPLRESEDVLWATIVFRWFNRITTGEVLLDKEIGLLDGEFRPEEIRARLLYAYPKGPWTTGAYMIKTPNGMDKIDGILWCLERIYPEVGMLASHMRPGDEASLEGVWEVLRGYPYLGDFMAYEVVTDLRHTAGLEKAEDINTWANPGPGAARGLARVEGVPLDHYNRHSEKDREELMRGMQGLLAASRHPDNWPWPSKPWELREVEHTLCEFDKYERARLGEGRPKQRLKT